MANAKRVKAAEAVARRRPLPPPDLDPAGEFRPDPSLAKWVSDTFIEREGPLANLDHMHLRMARIGYLWTNVPNARHQKIIAGTCELGKPNALGKWPKAQMLQQRREWFGDVPDFIITLDAGCALSMDDISFCAVIEHELSHARYELDEAGGIKFSKSTGLPVWALRGHDVEEFIGVASRYGAAGANVRELVDAVLAGPSIAPIRVSHACGNCVLKAV